MGALALRFIFQFISFQIWIIVGFFTGYFGQRKCIATILRGQHAGHYYLAHILAINNSAPRQSRGAPRHTIFS